MRWGISLLRGPGRTVALGVVAVAVLLRALDIGIVAESRLRVFDLEQRLWPRFGDPARVAIVAIDEKSLAQYGQWPWPRTLVTTLVRRIAEGRPRVLGIDILFAERDRLSPPEIARELPGLPRLLAEGLAQLPASEADLAEAMRAVPTVLALAPGREDRGPFSDQLHLSSIRQVGGDPSPFLVSYKSLLQSLPELGGAAQGAGAIAAEPDDDGIVRRAALAVSHRGTIIPSFALEVLRIGAGERSVVIDTGRFGIDDIRIGGVTIPTDSQGRAILHFSPRLARYIPAVDVLDPAFDPAELQSKIVLLGVAGLGIADLQQTPLGLVQGVDVHAQLIESMLLGALLHRPPYLDWIELAVALGVGLAAIWLLRYDQPVRATTIALATIAGLIGFELASFRLDGLLFDGTYTTATLLAAFGVMSVGNQRATEAARALLRRSFEHYLPPDLIAEMLASGTTPKLGGERREISVLFTDVAEFTTLSESMEPEFLATIVNDYFDGVCAAIFEQGGMVNEFIGDAVLAFFGVPHEQADHADRAVEAALGVDAFACRFSAEQKARGIDFGHTRIGVHTGTAMVGNVGTRSRLKYSALGDMLNTGSRLEGLNKTIGTRICVSGDIVRKDQGHCFRPIGSFVVKGRHVATEVFEPVDPENQDAERIDRYVVAFRALEAGISEAAEQFAALHREHPEDPCTTFHCQRLAAGESGTLIVMSEK